MQKRNIIDWEDYSNSEIEVKLKTLEFEYEKLKQEINEKGFELDNLNQNYIQGKTMLNKRLQPSKFK